MRSRALLLPLVALLGCGEELQEQYLVEIIGPLDNDYLAGGREVALEVGGIEVARTSISPGKAFSLAGTDIDVDRTKSGILRIKVLDEGGNLVAAGQSPEVELALFSRPPVRIFVQRPGTFGRSKNLASAVNGHVATTVVGGTPTNSPALPVSAALFGLGKAKVPVEGTNTTMEVFTAGLNLYNPITHEVDDIGASQNTSRGIQPRTDAAAITRPDGVVLIFGGQGPMAAGADATFSAFLDVLRLRRIGFDAFELLLAGTPRASTRAGVGRARSVLAVANGTFAFGGRAEGGPLDTVLAIDPGAVEADPFRVLDGRMAAPREGHTATAVNVKGVPQILIFGGAPAGQPVAELFLPETAPRFVRPEGPVGPGRRDHAAILLPAPDNRLILVGGLGDDGVPRGDSVLFNQDEGKLEASPLTLRKPRSAFAAFVVGGELVIAGGRDAQGEPIGDAEVFALPGLMPKAVVPAHPRARATATLLSNQSVVLVGGEETRGEPSPAVEIYQPRL